MCACLLAKEIEEPSRFFRRHGVREGGTAPLARVAKQRELTDREHRALSLRDVEIHLPLLVFENTQSRNLSGEERRVVGRIALRNAEENAETTFDASGFDPGITLLDGDSGGSDSLDDGTHRGSDNTFDALPSKADGGGGDVLDERFLDSARALIRARSVSEEGNLPALDVLEPLCREAGLVTERRPSPDTPERDANLLAGPAGGRNARGEPLLLVTHTDTVAPGPREAWRTDPFEFAVEGNRAYGLGVADVKLDALCKIEALRRLKDTPLERPVWFLGTYGEEAGLRGAKAFAADLPFRPRYVLCGEPSELALYTAHKGYCLLIVKLTPLAPRRVAVSSPQKLVFEGRAVHSSTPHLGENAAEKALDALVEEPTAAIVEIEAGESTNTIPGHCEAFVVADPEPGESVDLMDALQAAKRLSAAWRKRVAFVCAGEDTRFDPPTALGSLTRLRGRDGALEVAFDARLLPRHDGEALVRDFLLDLSELCDLRIKPEVIVRRTAEGMALGEDSELVRVASGVLRKLGLDDKVQSKPTSTEAGVFARLGLEAAVFGPSVSKGNAHRPNEYALLDQVERAVEVYERLILAFCG